MNTELTTEERQQAIELVESLLQEEDWAAHEMKRYFKLFSGWRAEWTRLHELRAAWMEKIRARPPVYPVPTMDAPLNLFAIEEVRLTEVA